MTAASVAGSTSAPVSRPTGLRVTQSRVVRSEWTKFRSLRSTVYTLLIAVVFMIGIGAMFSAITANQPTGFEARCHRDFDVADRHVLRAAGRRGPRGAADHR